MAVLTDKGLEYDKIDSILAKLQDIARQKFASLLEAGEELSVDESSVLGRILGIDAETDALQEELLFQMWNSFDPDQAEGIYLDKLFELVGMTRKPAAPAIASLMLRGDIGTTVVSGSAVSSTRTGDRFVTTADVVFSTNVTNGVVLQIGDLLAGKTYVVNYTSTDTMNVYPPIGVMYQNGDTKKTVASRLSETINSLSSVLESFVDNDDMVHVRFENPNTIGAFTATNMTIMQSYMPVTAYSATFTAVRQLAGTLSVIQSPVLGWREVYNPFDSLESSPAETDAEFRRRFKLTKGKDSYGNRQAMYADLYALDGVRYVNIQENIQDIPLEGRSAHGVSIVVLGGNDLEIAQTIGNNLPLGCITDGDLEYPVKDINDGSYTVKFSRPELVPIKVKLALTTDINFPQDGLLRIQDAIISYFDTLNVGDDIYLSRLYTPINTVEGQSVNSLQIGKVGQDFGTNNIEILYNQLATITYENITV